MRLALDIGFGHTKYAYHDGKQMIIGKIPCVSYIFNIKRFLNYFKIEYGI